MAMAPNSPSWLPFASPIISAAGSLLIYHRWIIDHRIKSKDDQIDYLNSQLSTEVRSRQEIENKWQSEVEEKIKLQDTLEEILQSIREGEVSAEDVLTVRRVISNLQKLGSLNDRLEANRVAASHLHEIQPPLVKEAASVTVRRFKDSIIEFQSVLPWKHKQNTQKFKADITSYLDWVYDCLYVGHPQNNPLYNFVRHPFVSSAEPYVEAIRHIQTNGNWDVLTVEQSTRLLDMFDELVERLPYEFDRR